MSSSGPEYHWGQRLMFGAYSYVQYVFHFLAPVNLTYLYFFPMDKGHDLPFFMWMYPLLMSLIFWFIYEIIQTKNRLVLFGILFMSLNLLLVLHFIPVPRLFIMADRYMYLSIIGLALVLVRSVDYLIMKYRISAWLIKLLGAGCLVILGLLSVNYLFRWKDSKTLKADVFELIESRKESNHEQ